MGPTLYQLSFGAPLKIILTIVMLNFDSSFSENTVDPEQHIFSIGVENSVVPDQLVFNEAT